MVSNSMFFGGNLLRVRASCQCSSGAQEVVRLWLGSKCTILVGSIDEDLAPKIDQLCPNCSRTVPAYEEEEHFLTLSVF